MTGAVLLSVACGAAMTYLIEPSGRLMALLCWALCSSGVIAIFGWLASRQESIQK